MNQKWKNIRSNFTIKNLISAMPSRILIVCIFFIVYNLSINRLISNFVWGIFFLTFFITISGLSRKKYVKFLESDEN